jgi:hypothetical protein
VPDLEVLHAHAWAGDRRSSNRQTQQGGWLYRCCRCGARCVRQHLGVGALVS